MITRAPHYINGNKFRWRRCTPSYETREQISHRFDLCGVHGRNVLHGWVNFQISTSFKRDSGANDTRIDRHYLDMRTISHGIAYVLSGRAHVRPSDNACQFVTLVVCNCTCIDVQGPQSIFQVWTRKRNKIQQNCQQFLAKIEQIDCLICETWHSLYSVKYRYHKTAVWLFRIYTYVMVLSFQNTAHKFR